MVAEIVDDRTTFSKLVRKVMCDHTIAYCGIYHVMYN